MIAAHSTPDHATIARFVERHEAGAGRAVRRGARRSARRPGWPGSGSSRSTAPRCRPTRVATPRATTSRSPREILEEATAVDAAEDELYGEARGDELPPELASAQGRKQWLREAKRRLDEQRAAEARADPALRPKRLKEAKRRLEEQLWTECRANAAYEDYRARGVMKNGRRFGAPPEPYPPPATPQGKINMTDPDSRLVKGMRGLAAGLQRPGGDQRAADRHRRRDDDCRPTSATSNRCSTPRATSCTAVGVAEPPDGVVADAGYWHQDQMQRVVADGTPVLIPPDSRSREGSRPGWDGGLYAFMRRVLATDRGDELYRQRQQSSSRSSPTPSSTAASTASTDEAEPPSGPNGG